jgi:hypothetical protein
MSEANYRIRYKKSDFEIEVQGDKAWVEEKFEQLKKDILSKTAIPDSSSSQTTTPLIEGTTLPGSLVEFITEKGNPRGHQNRALLFAYWLFKRENMASYNYMDIEKCFDETRLPKPANITDVMNRLQAQGLVTTTADKDSRKAWVITATGERNVEQMNE